jgi:hypothetical protein
VGRTDDRIHYDRSPACLLQHSSSVVFTFSISDQLTAYEKVQLWKTDTGDFEEIAGFTPDELPIEGEDELSDGSDLSDGIDDYSEAWDLVFGSLVFTKLRARITRAAILTPQTGQVLLIRFENSFQTL